MLSPASSRLAHVTYIGFDLQLTILRALRLTALLILRVNEKRTKPYILPSTLCYLSSSD